MYNIEEETKQSTFSFILLMINKYFTTIIKYNLFLEYQVYISLLILIKYSIILKRK